MKGDSVNMRGTGGVTTGDGVSLNQITDDFRRSKQWNTTGNFKDSSQMESNYSPQPVGMNQDYKVKMGIDKIHPLASPFFAKLDAMEYFS